MVHFIVQVCTAAGNLLAGNSLRESQPCMLRFFSTHIAAGEFDPTEDVVPQLEALDVCKPAPMWTRRKVLGAAILEIRTQQRPHVCVKTHQCVFHRSQRYSNRHVVKVLCERLLRQRQLVVLHEGGFVSLVPRLRVVHAATAWYVQHKTVFSDARITGHFRIRTNCRSRVRICYFGVTVPRLQDYMSFV